MYNYWLKQTVDKPLFNDLLWSRPENKRLGGKLLIIGGNSHGFSTPVMAYSEALKAGIGTSRVLLPDSTHKMLKQAPSEVSFAPSNLSGSFSKASLGDLMEASDWADGVLMAGEIGNNSETVVMFEDYLDKFKGLVVLVNDGVNLVSLFSDKVLNRAGTVLVCDIPKLQKLSEKILLPSVIKHGVSLINLTQALHELTIQKKISLVLEHESHLYVAHCGQVSTTEYKNAPGNWSTKVACHSAVWAIQNPYKLFEALSCSAITVQE